MENPETYSQRVICTNCWTSHQMLHVPKSMTVRRYMSINRMATCPRCGCSGTVYLSSQHELYLDTEWKNPTEPRHPAEDPEDRPHIPNIGPGTVITSTHDDHQ